MGFTKYILPIVAGVMAGMILIALGQEYVVARLFSSVSATMLLVMMANHAICSVVAGGISTAIVGRTSKLPATIIGVALLLAGLYNVNSFGLPLWFRIISPVIHLPFSLLGYYLVVMLLPVPPKKQG